MKLEHPSITGTYLVIEGHPSDLKRILVVETNLSTTDGGSKHYDTAKIDDVIKVATDFMMQEGINKIADGLRIVPAR